MSTFRQTFGVGPDATERALDAILRGIQKQGGALGREIQMAEIPPPPLTSSTSLGVFPWRIVPQGDDTVKVMNNGYLYGEGDDPVVWKFENVVDWTITVADAGSIWFDHTYNATDELIHVQGYFGSGHPDVHTKRKAKGTGDTVLFRAADPTPGNTDVFTGTTTLHVEVGEVDLVDGNATLVRQIQREYFPLPQDTFVVEVSPPPP